MCTFPNAKILHIIDIGSLFSFVDITIVLKSIFIVDTAVFASLHFLLELLMWLTDLDDGTPCASSA